MKPIVYVVQNVHGKNLLPAEKFGTLRVLLQGRESQQEAVAKLAQGLMDFRAGVDYLLPIGHPIFIGIASHIVLSLTQGTMNVLLWRPEEYKYQNELVTI